MAARITRFRRTTEQEREAFVREFQHSGLSRKDFAKKHGFAIWSLHRWISQGTNLGEGNRPQRLSEVQLIPCLSSSSWAAEVVSPSGVTMRFREVPKIEELARILSGVVC